MNEEHSECSWCRHTDRDHDGIGENNIWFVLTYGGDRSAVVINYSMLAVNLAYNGMLVTRRDSPGVQRCGWRMAALLLVVAFPVGLCVLVGCAGISIVWCAVAGWLWRELGNSPVHTTDPDITTDSDVVDDLTPVVQPQQQQHLLSNTTSEQESTQNEEATAQEQAYQPSNQDDEDGNTTTSTADWHQSNHNRPQWLLSPEVMPMLFILNAAVLLYYLLTLPMITTVAHLCALVLGYAISKAETTILCV